jgi:FkbM family methyltransferase
VPSAIGAGRLYVDPATYSTVLWSSRKAAVSAVGCAIPMTAPTRRAMIRVAGIIARRTDRPEILAATDRTARRDLRQHIAGKAIVPALIGPDATYVDVGTNRGQWLSQALRSAPGGRHLAFEANPDLCIQLKGSFPRVEIRTVALSDTPSTAKFCRFRNLDGFSGLVRRPEIHDDFDMIDVRVARLDDEIGNYAPSLIKVDVEGAEVNVLLGARNTLNEHHPAIIFEHQSKAAALYQHSSSELWELLADLDYRIFNLTGDGPFSRGEFVTGAASDDQLNWLAAPSVGVMRHKVIDG